MFLERNHRWVGRRHLSVHQPGQDCCQQFRGEMGRQSNGKALLFGFRPDRPQRSFLVRPSAPTRSWIGSSRFAPKDGRRPDRLRPHLHALVGDVQHDLGGIRPPTHCSYAPKRLRRHGRVRLVSVDTLADRQLRVRSVQIPGSVQQRDWIRLEHLSELQGGERLIVAMTILLRARVPTDRPTDRWPSFESTMRACSRSNVRSSSLDTQTTNTSMLVLYTVSSVIDQLR